MISNSGIRFISSWEKQVLYPYDANKAVNKQTGVYDRVYERGPNMDLTIGWGHSISPEEDFEKEYKNGITVERAAELFYIDLQKHMDGSLIPRINDCNLILTQNQFDAMVSFVFNMGSVSFSYDDEQAKQAMRNFLLAGDYSPAAAEKAYAVYTGDNTAPGNKIRRQNELKMFLEGI